MLCELFIHLHLVTVPCKQFTLRACRQVFTVNLFIVRTCKQVFTVNLFTVRACTQVFTVIWLTHIWAAFWCLGQLMANGTDVVELCTKDNRKHDTGIEKKVIMEMGNICTRELIMQMWQLLISIYKFNLRDKCTLHGSEVWVDWLSYLSLILGFFKCLPFRGFLAYSSETWLYH